MENITPKSKKNKWPESPERFPELMTPVEDAIFLRLNETNLTPEKAIRTLKYWRNQGQLKATKYIRRVWSLKNRIALLKIFHEKA